MTVSVQTATTIAASGTVTAGASISGIVAQAKVEVSGKISKSQTVTVGHTYSHAIPASLYGNMQYGSDGYNVGWSYYFDGANCTTVRVSSGTAKLPTSTLGWKYWSTTS